MADALTRAQIRKYSRAHTIRKMLRRNMANVQDLELSTLERARREAVTAELRRYAGDVLWRVRVRGAGWMYLVILPEFEPEPHRYVPERILAYGALAFDEAVRQRAFGLRGELPHVVPAAIYNEYSYWRMAPDLSDLVATGEQLIAYRPERPEILKVAPAGQEHPPLSHALVPVLTDLECDLTMERAEKVIEVLEDWLWSPPPGDRAKLGFSDWVANLPARRGSPLPMAIA